VFVFFYDFFSSLLVALLAFDLLTSNLTRPASFLLPLTASPCKVEFVHILLASFLLLLQRIGGLDLRNLGFSFAWPLWELQFGLEHSLVTWAAGIRLTRGGSWQNRESGASAIGDSLQPSPLLVLLFILSN
jgi:hypothetical protein